MTRREANATLLAAAALAAMPSAAHAQGDRMLPEPRKEAGKPLMQALQLRRSIRAVLAASAAAATALRPAVGGLWHQPPER